jgi:hypothetical protein
MGIYRGDVAGRPNAIYQTINGIRMEGVAEEPDVSADVLAAAAALVSPAPAPPHLIFTFDTIGQTIYRSIGNVRLPLRPIWAQGIEESGDETTSNTQTAAFALCAPIDPDEDIDLFALWDGGTKIYHSGTATAPAGWTDSDIALLLASIDGAMIYPGDEAQEPAPLIVADKGPDRTNAFRGIRYIVIPNYPLRGANGGGLPQLSGGFTRTKKGGTPAEDKEAVEFLGGSS